MLHEKSLLVDLAKDIKRDFQKYIQSRSVHLFLPKFTFDIFQLIIPYTHNKKKKDKKQNKFDNY
ncbi:hypothetical protein BpHYR1_010690 [Brachionus plicatilis]|uniref:Uncharacterized protein n=1 Tax=Brachionus plicatilis TaxID=10195 RepID=A0A3M7SVT7_BRAPC|nr:hypothetical protein BpHYR1_010690 [Brachionus plicatilis]